METVLIVDDDKNYRSLLSAILEDQDYKILTANNGRAAIDTLKDFEIDLLITDVKMPSMDGHELLETIRGGWPDTPVIMMTAHATVEKAVDAMQKGAFTYIEKPFDNEQFLLFVKRAIELSNMAKENKRLRHAVKKHYGFGNIIGKSRAMKHVFDIINKVAPTSASVLIEGESGTGKEMIAKSIHYNSPRQTAPIIIVNCSALSESLLESELFGHEKGAFTGADSTRKGRFESAHNGTLFLDEIGELSPNLQVKLLRVLQEKKIERVGSTSSIDVNFRLIAATNKHLVNEVNNGNFREDLYYRLNVVHIDLPPLRKRTEDIHLLIHHFINKYGSEPKRDRPVKGIDQKCEKILLNHPWPGNIRQLENVIERAMIMASDEYISLSDLPNEFTDTTNVPEISSGKDLYATLAAVEKQLIINSLIQSNGIQAHAAKLLNIGKSGLNQKIKKLNISPAQYKPPHQLE